MLLLYFIYYILNCVGTFNLNYNPFNDNKIKKYGIRSSNSLI